MTEHEAKRTLVKSPPELWAECSDAASLSRHLNDGFGEIRITRLEPETAVAWEGEHGSGTVRLEPSGWGTRVILTAQARGGAEGQPAPPDASPPPAASSPPAAPLPSIAPPASAVATRPSRPGLFSRLFSRYRTAPAPPVPPAPADPLEPPRPLVFEPWLAPPDGAPVEPTPEPAPAVPSQAPPAPAPAGDPEATEDSDGPEAAVPDPAAALIAALDSLGQAHHRPFSRA
jgi:hypothetical protein